MQYCMTETARQAVNRRWRRNHPEEVKARNRAYRQENKAAVKLAQQRWNTNNPEKVMLATARKRARKFGLEFSISLDDVRIPEFCPVLGIRLLRGAKRACDASPALDRIDNSRGYVVGNVAVISMRANRIKADASAAELKLIAAYANRS